MKSIESLDIILVTYIPITKAIKEMDEFLDTYNCQKFNQGNQFKQIYSKQ